ncbi:TonB-dependent receptor [Sphingobacterium lumbrici]|uniref:TonB-dependent receptor n=1 Tax=Sphingobacterium lumbrici TaxID=2559600 RepID=UPI0011293031|nr:TonB-dependent receptor [Sphingobacterium lumbrici]
MKLNLNIKRASLLLSGIIVCSVVSAQKVDPKGNVLPKDSNKQDTTKTLNAQQKNSASIADGVAASGSTLGIRGRIIDVETMQPISGVSVSLADNSKATSTNENGEFIIPVNKKGIYEIVSSYLGYNKEITPVVLAEKNWENISVVLVSESSALDEVVVTRRRVQASEIALLEERKASNLMVEKIGAQELSRKGVSDAEGALTKMSGVTKSAGGANVFVRGLGDRYNSTTLNGLPLSSEDPLNKNVSLDFFGTSIIQSIAVNKTFNPTLGADVAGANIDILSKVLADNNFLEIGVSTGVNTQALKTDNFQKITGSNWFGSLAESKSTITNGSNYAFANKWNPKPFDGTPINSSFSLAGGKRVRVGENNLNVFLSANMNSEYKYYDGVVRQTLTNGEIFLDQKSTLSQYNIDKTAIANLKYSFGKHYVAFNSLYINNQSQTFEDNYGLNSFPNPNDRGLFRRQHIVDNNLFVNQLLSKLVLSDVLDLDLGIAHNLVKGNEPDRRTIRLSEVFEDDGRSNFYLMGEQNSNERYYSDLTENAWSTKAIATYNFDKESDFERKINFGYNGNIINRDFNATLYTHLIDGSRLLDPNNVYNIDNVFNSSTLQSNFFRLSSRMGNFEPEWYKANKRVHSAVLMGIYQFDPKFTALIGIRYDNVFQDVSYKTALNDSELNDNEPLKKNYVLPSLNLKYMLTEKSNLRASASMSYTLPQFIEMAEFLNTFSTYTTQGNPDLKPVQNTNFDVKWELFPTVGELISVGVFYKQLKDPIARTEMSGNVMTYHNVGSTATVAGAEIELKKNILKTMTENGDNVLSGGLNLSYLYSNQKLENILPRFTAEESALQGASPVLINTDVTYLWNRRDWNLTSTAVLNYFSDRIYSLGGSNAYRDIIEKGIPTLDVISQADIKKHWGINVKLRNLLNPAIRLERETDNGEAIALSSYKRGIDMSVGISYRF